MRPTTESSSAQRLESGPQYQSTSALNPVPSIKYDDFTFGDSGYGGHVCETYDHDLGQRTSGWNWISPKSQAGI